MHFLRKFVDSPNFSTCHFIMPTNLQVLLNSEFMGTFSFWAEKQNPWWHLQMRKKNKVNKCFFVVVENVKSVAGKGAERSPAGLIGPLDRILVLNQARLCFTFYPFVSCKKAFWKIKHSHLCFFIIEGTCARISGLFSAVHFWHFKRLNKVWGPALADITRATVCFLDNLPQTKCRVTFDTYFWHSFLCSFTWYPWFCSP